VAWNGCASRSGLQLQALRRHGGNVTKAAEEVGMYRQNFQQKMRELGISVGDAVPGEA
jgi:DNA-binding NtrC family response regulator